MRLPLLLAVLCVACAGARRRAGDGTLELVILHNNDMHARFEETSRLSGVCSPADRDAHNCYGGFARVAHVVKEARRKAEEGTGPKVLYLNAGDTYSGTAWFTIYKWKIAADFINALKPDAVSLGNHEFDFGISGLIPFIDNLTCPVLAANLVLTKSPELAAQRNLLKSTVIHIDKHLIGIIGYLTPDTRFITSLPPDIDYTDEVESLNEEARKLKNKGVQILIALGHSGWSKDLDIARKVQDIDLVIGGHNNMFLWNGTAPDTEKVQGPYPTMVRQESGKIVPVVQAYAFTKYLGKMHMIFNTHGEMISYKGSQAILLDSSIPQDFEVLDLTEKYKANLTTITSKVIGSSSEPLSGGALCRVEECKLGNVITDSIIYYYQKVLNKTHAPIALVVGGGIRASIPKSSDDEKITFGHLLEVLPFKNSIVGVKMNGSVLLQALEHSVDFYDADEPKGDFLQISGIEVTFDFTNKPGNRVLSARARCTVCDRLEVVTPRLDYLVLTNNFVAAGGNHYSMFSGLNVTELNFDDITSLEDYIRHNSPVKVKLGRITLLHGAQNSCVSVKNVSLLTYVVIITLIHDFS